MKKDTNTQIFPTNCAPIDRMLMGGFPVYSISLIYGEAETGKTSLAMQCAINSARMGYKVIVMDSDSSFSLKRLSQIANDNIKTISPQITIVKPTTFEEQTLSIDRLDEYLSGKVGLIIVDTITSLYRVELGAIKKNYELNRELNRQVASLVQITKKNSVATILISQVRSVFNTGQNISRVSHVEPVGTRVLRFWSDIIISLEHTGQTRVKKVVLEKHPQHKRSVSSYFRIERRGIYAQS